DLPFRRERISSVFNTKKLGTSYRASPVAAVRPNRSKSGSMNSWILPRRDSKPNGGDDDLIGWGPPDNSDVNSSSAPVQSPTSSDGPPTWRSLSAAKAKAAGHNRTKSFFQGRPSDEAFARIKSLSPGACNQYYLRGQCYY